MTDPIVVDYEEHLIASLNKMVGKKVTVTYPKGITLDVTTLTGKLCMTEEGELFLTTTLNLDVPLEQVFFAEPTTNTIDLVA